MDYVELQCGVWQNFSVRCGVVWHGAVWCGMVRCDVAWRCVVRCHLLVQVVALALQQVEVVRERVQLSARRRILQRARYARACTTLRTRTCAVTN